MYTTQDQNYDQVDIFSDGLLAGQMQVTGWLAIYQNVDLTFPPGSDFGLGWYFIRWLVGWLACWFTLNMNIFISCIVYIKKYWQWNYFISCIDCIKKYWQWMVSDGRWQVIEKPQNFLWSTLNYLSSKNFKKVYLNQLRDTQMCISLSFLYKFENLEAYISLNIDISLHIFCLGMLGIDNEWSDMAWQLN